MSKSKAEHSRLRVARKLLLFWCLFIGIGAVAGATGMLSAPDGSALGMQGMLPYFQVLPFSDILFQDFTFPGISLLIVNGITNLAAAVFIMSKKKAGLILGGVFGVTLMLWICIQFVIFPMNFMSAIYFIFGFLQAATGYAACVFYKQENFSVRLEDYPNIGTNKRELVVYFSRLGYTRKIALETADKFGADIYEIISTEPTSGTKGFWWCGRFGMNRMDMPIAKPDIDFSQYDKVTICSPVWVFSLAAPVRTFCKQVCGKIKTVDCILLHHMGSCFAQSADEIVSLTGAKKGSFTSIVCRKGKFTVMP